LKKKGFFPLFAARHGSFSQIKLFLFVLKNAGAFWSAKVPKALCQSGNGPFTQPYTHQKNSGTSFNQVLIFVFFGLIEPFWVCVQYLFKVLNYRL